MLVDQLIEANYKDFLSVIIVNEVIFKVELKIQHVFRIFYASF